MQSLGHLTLGGLQQIVALKSVLNHGLSAQLKAAFPNLPTLTKPVYLPSLVALHPFWVSGFITGDGSFHVSISPKNYVLPAMTIQSYDRELLLLKKIHEFFGFGGIYISGNKVDYKVAKFSYLLSLISHFNSYPVGGLKLYNYNIWVEILELISWATISFNCRRFC